MDHCWSMVNAPLTQQSHIIQFVLRNEDSYTMGNIFSKLMQSTSCSLCLTLFPEYDEYDADDDEPRPLVPLVAALLLLRRQPGKEMPLDPPSPRPRRRRRGLRRREGRPRPFHWRRRRRMRNPPGASQDGLPVLVLLTLPFSLAIILVVLAEAVRVVRLFLSLVAVNGVEVRHGCRPVLRYRLLLLLLGKELQGVSIE